MAERRHNGFVVIVPARNEEKTLRAVLWEVREVFDGEIVVVDDASSDGTAAIAREEGATVVPMMEALGAWGATQAGFLYALSKGYDIAVTMDADGQHVAEYLPHLVDPIKTDTADMVIGADTSRGDASRQVAWKVFRAISGLALEDLTSGFRSYNSKAMAMLASPQAGLLDYQDIGVLLLLHRLNLRMQEREVKMRKRKAGRSRVFGSWLVIGSYMIQTLLICISRTQRFNGLTRKRT